MCKNNYSVNTADWTMEVYVDESIFDDPYVEACTRGIEYKSNSLKNGEDFLVNPVMFVKRLTNKKSRKKAINTYKVLLNAGFPTRAEMLRKIFYMSTSIDLANEPLSSSKI